MEYLQNNFKNFKFNNLTMKKTRCRAEIDEVIGSRTEITYDDITKLKYLSCVFKEALRLYPPVPEIARLATEAMNINGFYLPPNTDMIVGFHFFSHFLFHNNLLIWKISLIFSGLVILVLYLHLLEKGGKFSEQLGIQTRTILER